MKQIITNLLLAFSPFSLFCQVVSDTSFLFEKAEDEFHEYYWQDELEISHDTTFYYLNTKIEIDRLEVISLSDKVVWDSEEFKTTFSIPAKLCKENQYFIRIYGLKGITEVIWFP